MRGMERRDGTRKELWEKQLSIHVDPSALGTKHDQVLTTFPGLCRLSGEVAGGLCEFKDMEQVNMELQEGKCAARGTRNPLPSWQNGGGEEIARVQLSLASTAQCRS